MYRPAPRGRRSPPVIRFAFCCKGRIRMIKKSNLWPRWSVVCAAACLSITASANGAQAAVGKRCTADFAKVTMSSSDPMEICTCEVVTLGFVRYLQNRTEFGDILEQTADQCPALATVLSETPTASVRGPRRQNEERPDGDGPRDGPTPTATSDPTPASDPPPSDPPEYDWPEDGCGGCQIADDLGPDFRSKNPADYGYGS